MTKDVVIGTVAGVVAVLAVAVLSPRAQQLPAGALPVVELAGSPSPFYEGLGKSYLPTTRPDPTKVRLERHRIERVEARQMPLEKLIQYFRETTGVNLFVSWRALEAAGIDRHAPVTLDLRDVSAAVALKMAMKEVGGENIMLGYLVADNVVTISTAEDLAKETVTRIYDVRDLIDEEFAHRRRADNNPQKPVVEQDAVDALNRILQETIDPTSWRDAGGSVGAIMYFGGRLIVTQTHDNHDQVLELLAALRLTAAPPLVAPKQGR
jgi:hypothetical protein